MFVYVIVVLAWVLREVRSAYWVIFITHPPPSSSFAGVRAGFEERLDRG